MWTRDTARILPMVQYVVIRAVDKSSQYWCKCYTQMYNILYLTCLCHAWTNDQTAESLLQQSCVALESQTTFTAVSHYGNVISELGWLCTKRLRPMCTVSFGVNGKENTSVAEVILSSLLLQISRELVQIYQYVSTKHSLRFFVVLLSVIDWSLLLQLLP